MTGKSARQVLRAGFCQLFRPGVWCAEDSGGHLDRLGVGRCLGRVRVPGIQARAGQGERGGASPGGRPVGCLFAGGGLGEHEPGDAVLAGEPGRVPAGGDDVRGGGEVDLDGAAEPGAVPLAGPLVSGDVDGDRAALPVPGGAAPAGEGRADGRAPAAGERGERVPQGGFAGPGERGQVPDVRGLRLAGGGEVVAGGGPGGEPGREAGGDGAGRQVAGGRGARQVGGDRLAAERGGAERERPGTVLPCLRGRYGLPFPAGSAGGGDAVPAQLAGERGVAAGVAEGGDLAVQARAAQVGVVGGALADVGGERGEGVSVRAGLAGCPVPVEVDPDRLAVVPEAAGRSRTRSRPARPGRWPAGRLVSGIIRAGARRRRRCRPGWIPGWPS